MVVTSAPVSNLKLTSLPLTSSVVVQDICCFELTVPTKAVSKLNSFVVAATVLEKHWLLKWPFLLHLRHGASFAGHLAPFWCFDLPQRIHLGLPGAVPRAVPRSDNRLSDRAIESRLRCYGWLERLPLTCSMTIGCCLLPSPRSCEFCSAIASF